MGIVRFFKQSALYQGIGQHFGYDPIDDIINSALATATTPDMLIVSSILKKVATEPELWKFVTPYGAEFDFEITYSREAYNCCLGNEPIKVVSTADTDFSCEFKFRFNSRDNDNMAPYLFGHVVVTVNDVDLDEAASRYFFHYLRKLRIAWEKTKRQAKESREAMTLNEKKWNVAEALLGMKRAENGALVPADFKEGEQL